MSYLKFSLFIDPDFIGGTAYHSGAPKFTPSFLWVRVAQSLVFCVLLCGI